MNCLISYIAIHDLSHTFIFFKSLSFSLTRLKSSFHDLEMCMEESNSCHLPFATTDQNVVQDWGRRSSQFTHMQKRLAENQCSRLNGLISWACHPYTGLCASVIVPTCSTSSSSSSSESPECSQVLHWEVLQRQSNVTPFCLLPNCKGRWTNLTPYKDLKHRKAAQIKKME